MFRLLARLSQIPIPRCPNNCKIAQSQRINRRGWADRRRLDHKQVCYQQKNNKEKNILLQNAYEVEQKKPSKFCCGNGNIYICSTLFNQPRQLFVHVELRLAVCLQEFTSVVSVVRSWEFSQNLGFLDMNWDHFLDFGKFPKPTKVWEFWPLVKT